MIKDFTSIPDLRLALKRIPSIPVSPAGDSSQLQHCFPMRPFSLSPCSILSAAMRAMLWSVLPGGGNGGSPQPGGAGGLRPATERV